MLSSVVPNLAGLRFDVNLSTLFTDLPLLERPAAAASEGFGAVELWWPFQEPVPRPRQVEDLVEAIAGKGLTLACFNLYGGDFSAGERGVLSLPEDRGFGDNVEAVLDIAQRLNCRVLNALYGNLRPGLPHGCQDAIAAERLARAAVLAAKIGARVVLETLNPTEFPRYGLHRLDQAAALADRVRREWGVGPGLLFDVYNVQRAEGDLVTRFRSYAPRVLHVQIADVPERRAPGTGEVAFDRLLPAISATGYAGFIGLEYLPSPNPADTFAWLSREPGGGVGSRTKT